jgi:hypothetical protein
MVVAFGRRQDQPPGRIPSAFHFKLISCFFSSDFPHKSRCKKQSPVVGRQQNPKIEAAVESHPCAQNAQGWGTRPTTNELIC